MIASESVDAAQHYETDPLFFQAFLDPYLKYGSGYFQGDESFEHAALRMLDRTIEQGSLRPGRVVLDVGSGWGSLRRRLQELNPQAQYHHINPSARQRGYAEKLFGPASVVYPTTVEEAALPLAAYDAVFLNDSVCHVRGRAQVLAKLRASLKHQGRIVVQDTFFLSEELYRRHHDARATRFVQEDVFGFAQIPSIETFMSELADAGLRPVIMEDISGHYRRTVAAWLKRLEELPSDRFPLRDRFRRYLRMAAAGLDYSIGQLFLVLSPLERSPTRLRLNLQMLSRTGDA